MSKLNPAFPSGIVRNGETQNDGMTLRQYAAIKLRVPDSGEPWLDAMITESLRNEFAAAALQGMLCRHGDDTRQTTVDMANWYASGMLAARQARSTETSGSVQAKEPTP